ncbi:MAG TPA: hypothetical protein VG435_02490 [Acidimicrobiales bacterium]|jgi:hypothetical protein|nr:hypothetical protein [Acidimicrobiales bacterium]
MTNKTELAAAERALAAWRAKHAPSRPPGFSVEEAAEITGTPEAMLDQWACLVHPSLGYEDDERYAECDLLRVMVAADLLGAGVPFLAVALLSWADERSYKDDPDSWRDQTEGWPHVYPLTVELAERWMIHPCEEPSRLLRPPENVALLDIAAEDTETRSCLANGEAILYEQQRTVERLQRRLDEFWVQHR